MGVLFEIPAYQIAICFYFCQNMDRTQICNFSTFLVHITFLKDWSDSKIWHFKQFLLVHWNTKCSMEKYRNADLRRKYLQALVHKAQNNHHEPQIFNNIKAKVYLIYIFEPNDLILTSVQGSYFMADQRKLRIVWKWCPLSTKCPIKS